MILELLVENFVIIDRINVKFFEGLNIITGETGTGKSVIVDAINLLLGSRADKSFIRTGCEYSLIEACFKVPNDNDINQLIDYLGINIDSDRIIIVSREIHTNGRNISRINGRPVALSVIKELTPNFLDIQGQNENQKLLKKKEQLNILDSLLDKEDIKLRNEISIQYKELTTLKKKLKKIDIDELKKEREMEILNFQINEIEDAALKLNEDSKLSAEYKKIQKINDIKATLYKAVSELDGDTYNGGVTSSLYKISADLSIFSEEDELFKKTSSSLMEIYYISQEISRDLSDYLRDIDYSDLEINEIEMRLDLINNLKRKYGNTVEEILSYKDELNEKFTSLKNLEEEIISLKNEIFKIESNIIEKAEVLSEHRKEISILLKSKIEKELKELNMGESIFSVDFIKRNEPNTYGIDDIEFLISTNRGQPLKPIAKVASGGEISRLMLAFKNVVGEEDELSTLIYDEIDMGISGRTAQLVGEKILKVSEKNQILCITHLPQIAAMADHHYLLRKSVISGETVASMKELSYEDKIDELSRLTGGVSVTESTRKHAIDMLRLSKKLKN